MPTYQSTPLMPLIYPDQAYTKNYQGVQPLRGNVLQLLPLEPSANPSWKSEADFNALAKVQNTLLGQQAMLKGPQSIKNSKPFTTYRGPNQEAFKHSTFTGGRVKNRESENLVSHLLKDRIEQLNALDEANFEEVKPNRLAPELPPPDTYVLDKLFSDLYSSLDQGLISNALLGLMSSILSYLATKADKIPDNKFDDYKGLFGKIRESLDVLFKQTIQERPELKDAGPILRKLDNDTLLGLRFIRNFVQFLGEPTKSKTARMVATRNRILAEFGVYIPQPGEPEYDEDASNSEAATQGTQRTQYEGVDDPQVAEQFRLWRESGIGRGKYRRRK